MPVKMEWDNTTMLTAMGMDWEDPTTDIAILDLPSLEFTGASDVDGAVHFGVNMFEPPASPISQIISHDCMWSGTCGDVSHPGMKSGSCCGSKKGSSCSGSSSRINSITTSLTNANNSSTASQQTTTTTITTTPTQVAVTKQAVKLNQIPAGRSLLLSSRMPTIASNTVKTVTNRMAMTSDKGGTNTRPDTPLSLDDETPEFKHQIDLVGSIAGSASHLYTHHSQSSHQPSYIKREREDSQTIIDMLKKHLEDDDVEGQKSGQISEILSSNFTNRTDNVLDYLKYLSDYEEAADDDSTMDSDSEYASSYGSEGQGNSGAGKIANYHNLPTIKAEYQETSFGDHSYTRPKDRFDTRDLGVQTPSDSGKWRIHFLCLYQHLPFFSPKNAILKNLTPIKLSSDKKNQFSAFLVPR